MDVPDRDSRCNFCKIVLFILFPLICLAITFPDYPKRQVDECAISAEKSGLRIGLQPIEDPQEQQTYFHTSMASKGYLPVFIVMQNGTADESFLFDKSKVTYGSADLNGATPQIRSKVGEALIVMRAITRATEVQVNIVKKELQSKTLSPGASASGFLYVNAPTGSPREKVHLIIPVTKASTNETLSFDLSF